MSNVTTNSNNGTDEFEWGHTGLQPDLRAEVLLRRSSGGAVHGDTNGWPDGYGQVLRGVGERDVVEADGVSHCEQKPGAC